MDVHLEYYPYQSGNNFSQFLDQKLPRDDNLNDLHLKLTSPKLSNEDINTFFNRIRHLKVESLNLSFNQLGDENMPYIVTGVTTNECIRRLILNHNNIQDRGAEALAALMTDRRDLDIDLCDNKIGSDGGCNILRAVLQTYKRKLDLSQNKIGDDGAREMSNVLAGREVDLRELILRHNDIRSEGDAALAQKVPSRVQIHYRTKTVSFYEAYPVLSILLVLIFFPSIFFLHLFKSEVYLEGCDHPRTAP